MSDWPTRRFRQVVPLIQGKPVDPCKPNDCVAELLLQKLEEAKLEIAHLEAMLEDSARGLVKVREELKIIAARYEAALYRNDIY